MVFQHCTTFSHLGVVLLPGGGHVVNILLGWRRVSGWNVVLVLLRLHRVVHIHLSNPGGDHHLRSDQRVFRKTGDAFE